MKNLIHFIIIFLFSSIAFTQEIITQSIGCQYPIADTSKVKASRTVEPTLVIESVVDTIASFPNGKPALLYFLKGNLVFPEIAKELELSPGKTILKFVVLKDGSISQIKVARGMKECPECDREAVRVVKNMPKWIPAKKNGSAVNSYFVLPIEFKL